MFLIDFVEINDVETLSSDHIHFCNNNRCYDKIVIFAQYKNLYFSEIIDTFDF